MTSEQKQQFSARIVAANGSKLVEIIYEIMLVYLDEAKVCHEANTRKEFSTLIKKCKDCLAELRISIQPEHTLATNFTQLYDFCDEELTKADVHFDDAPLNGIIDMMERFREAYEVVSKNDTSKPVMDNAQSIYAGLTYGKNTLNENLSNQGDNRGFLI